MENAYYPFENLPLPYDYDALEPFIGTETLHFHHDKHLQAYVNNLNQALANQPQLQSLSLEQLIANAASLPASLQTPIRNNAGGVYNHRFYFSLLSSRPQCQPEGPLAAAIHRDFGGSEAFQSAFHKAALAVFGSGYAWLVADQGTLRIVTTPNQNCPIEQGLSPILTIDVWEHAYYLDYQNLRKDYIDSWFQVLSWEQADRNFCQLRR